MSEQIYLATIGAEASGAVRGKISNAVTRHLGANPGDVLQFTISGPEGRGKIVSVDVLRGQKAQRATASAKSPAPKAAVKPVKPAAKPTANRTTKVAMKPAPAPAVAPKTVKKAVKKVVKGK